MTATATEPAAGQLPAAYDARRDGRCDALCGDAVCERVAGRSVLTRVWATDPLKLLTPAGPGDAARVVTSSYGGGLLGGDHVGLRLRVGADAALVVTTQSAGKVYRTEGRRSTQGLTATADDGAVLAVLPDALCPFAGARFAQTQEFDLSPAANLVWLDWISSGRHGRGERWQAAELTSRTIVRVGGRPRLRETLALDGGEAAVGSPLRAGRFDCYAVLAAFGPRLGPFVDAGRTVVRAVTPGRVLAADAAADGGAVFRVLGPDVQTVRDVLRRLLSPLDALLGGDPWARKW